MNKAVKKLRKLKDQLDKIEEKEDDILSKIDEAIDELEESEDQDVESGSFILFNGGGGFDCLPLSCDVDPTVSLICFCFLLTLAFKSSVSMPSKIGEY